MYSMLDLIPNHIFAHNPLSLNNRPPLRPSRSQKAEACRFLPRERLGRSRVSVSHSPAGQRDSQELQGYVREGAYVDLVERRGDSYRSSWWRKDAGFRVSNLRAPGVGPVLSSVPRCSRPFTPWRL